MRPAVPDAKSPNMGKLSWRPSQSFDATKLSDFTALEAILDEIIS